MARRYEHICKKARQLSIAQLQSRKSYYQSNLELLFDLFIEIDSKTKGMYSINFWQKSKFNIYF